MSKVLLVYDVEGWAWHHMASGIKKYASSEYEVTIASSQDWADNCQDDAWLRQWQGILQMSWTEGATAWSSVSTQHRNSHKKTRQDVCAITTLIANDGPRYFKTVGWDWRTHIVTSIRNRKQAERKLPDFDRVLVVNEPLYEFMSTCSDFKNIQQIVHLPAGFDPDVFTPQRRDRGGVLRIGWCGNPRGTFSVKGYDRIWAVVKERLAAYDTVFTEITEDFIGAKSQHEVAEWMRSLDVFCCTSCSEGSPLTVIEALASGCHVISTDVGQCGSLGLGDNLLPTYTNEEEAAATVEAFVDRIEAFSRISTVDLSEQTRDNLSWEQLADRWLSFITKGS